MVKAKEIAGLDCSADALTGAALVLRVRFREIIELRDAALDFSDIEGVHNMRVATRRQRSALRDFTPILKARPLKQVKKDLKQLGDALGKVRDQDVAIATLEKLQAKTKAESIKDGIEILLKERRDLREIACLDLTKTLAIGNIDALQESFFSALEEGVKQEKSTQTFKGVGREIVAKNLQDFLDLGASIYEPFNETALHKLRIAAKRLRYSIELFAFCFGESIAPFADEIADMQNFLGEVHDCDVWIESLSRRLVDGKKTDGSDYQAAEWLLSEFVKNRTNEYRSGLELWSEWETNYFTERLRAAIL